MDDLGATAIYRGHFDAFPPKENLDIIYMSNVSVQHTKIIVRVK